MSDKIKRLAKNLAVMIPERETLQDTYELLTDYMFKQKEYFSRMSPHDIVKLLFYIWSIHKTHSTDAGDTILNDISFAVLFYTEGDNHKEECDDCDGDGEVRCHVCDGDGNVLCNECDGDDELDYNEYFIVTWNKFIKDRCELTEDDSDITLSEYDFDRLRNKYVVLHMEQKHADLMDFVESNELYCIYYNDNPSMYFTPKMELYTHNNRISSFVKR